MKSSPSIFDNRSAVSRPAVRAVAPVGNTRLHDAAIDDDELMLSVLLAPPAAGETTYVAFQRKEQALAQVFASLTPPAARVLSRRLLNATDPLAGAFGRLVVERQNRLFAILRGAPRRAAIAAARRSP